MTRNKLRDFDPCCPPSHWKPSLQCFGQDTNEEFLRVSPPQHSCHGFVPHPGGTSLQSIPGLLNGISKTATSCKLFRYLCSEIFVIGCEEGEKKANLKCFRSSLKRTLKKQNTIPTKLSVTKCFTPHFLTQPSLRSKLSEEQEKKIRYKL